MKYLLAAAAVLLIAGCSMFNAGEQKTNISVSMMGISGPEAAGMRSTFDIHPLTDETHYKDNLKEDKRGSLVGSFTPQQFFLDIDYILLYQEQAGSDEYVSERILPDRTTPGGTYIPRHINVIHARHFIRDVEISLAEWDGFSMKFLPHKGTSGNVFYVKSFIGVDLGDDYEGIILDNQVTEDALLPDDGLHYFTFDHLQPYVTGFLGYITIGGNISEAGIQNPTGDSGSWNLPGDPPTHGNSSQVFFPGTALDLSSFSNPEIIFYWDMESLIEVYDMQSDVLSDHIVTFSLGNPFPVSITIEEKQSSPGGGTPGDIDAPGDVLCAAAVVLDDSIILQWINPKDEDFDQVVVVRKAESAPASLSDGVEVYAGHEPNFCDTEAEQGMHYYYRIFAVDFSGNASMGIVVDAVMN